MRKELGFSRTEWDSLDGNDKRMYAEELARENYNQEVSNWQSTKKGPPPKEPEFMVMERKKKENDPNAPADNTKLQGHEGMAPDIEDML